MWQRHLSETVTVLNLRSDSAFQDLLVVAQAIGKNPMAAKEALGKHPNGFDVVDADGDPGRCAEPKPQGWQNRCIGARFESGGAAHARAHVGHAGSIAPPLAAWAFERLLGGLRGAGRRAPHEKGGRRSYEACEETSRGRRAGQAAILHYWSRRAFAEGDSEAPPTDMAGRSVRGGPSADERRAVVVCGLPGEVMGSKVPAGQTGPRSHRGPVRTIRGESCGRSRSVGHECEAPCGVGGAQVLAQLGRGVFRGQQGTSASAGHVEPLRGSISGKGSR